MGRNGVRVTTFEYAMARAKPIGQRVDAAVARTWRRTRGHLFAVSGFASLCSAAFMWETIAGLVAVGVSCFVLEQRGKSGDRP
jgi:hypothetical protein